MDGSVTVKNDTITVLYIQCPFDGQPISIFQDDEFWVDHMTRRVWYAECACMNINYQYRLTSVLTTTQNHPRYFRKNWGATVLKVTWCVVFTITERSVVQNNTLPIDSPEISFWKTFNQYILQNLEIISVQVFYLAILLAYQTLYCSIK